MIKDFKFAIKTLTDQGQFDGLAAVYGNVDLGGDIIAPGAFTKTLKEKNSQVPILWQHDAHEPIGLGTLTDGTEGLLIHGDLVMESPVAQKAYALMKADVLKGLSIGYDTVVSEYDSAHDIRTLKELKLWEVSTVTFPMNTRANVTSVKALAEALENEIGDLLSRTKALRAEMKDGRTHSEATMQRLKASHAAMQVAMENLKALIEPPEGDGKSAANRTDGPDLHPSFSSLESLLSKRLFA